MSLTQKLNYVKYICNKNTKSEMQYNSVGDPFYLGNSFEKWWECLNTDSFYSKNHDFGFSLQQHNFIICFSLQLNDWAKAFHWFCYFH